MAENIFVGLIALLVSVLTSYITVRLSIRQFRSERWWEKQTEAYSQILESLSQLHYWYDEWENELLGIGTRQVKSKELQEKSYQAEEWLSRSSALGAYLISERTSKALSELNRVLVGSRGGEDPNDVISSCFGAVKKCMKIVKEEAKKDLDR